MERNIENQEAYQSAKKRATTRVGEKILSKML